MSFCKYYCFQWIGLIFVKNLLSTYNIYFFYSVKPEIKLKTKCCSANSLIIFIQYYEEITFLDLYYL